MHSPPAIGIPGGLRIPQINAGPPDNVNRSALSIVSISIDRHSFPFSHSAFRTPNPSPLVKLHKSAYSLLCKCPSIPKVRKAVPFPKKAQNLPSESTSEMSLFPFSFLCILPIDKKPRKPL